MDLRQEFLTGNAFAFTGPQDNQMVFGNAAYGDILAGNLDGTGNSLVGHDNHGCRIDRIQRGRP